MGVAAAVSAVAGWAAAVAAAKAGSAAAGWAMAVVAVEVEAKAVGSAAAVVVGSGLEEAGEAAVMVAAAAAKVRTRVRSRAACFVASVSRTDGGMQVLFVNVYPAWHVAMVQTPALSGQLEYVAMPTALLVHTVDVVKISANADAPVPDSSQRNSQL